MLHQIIAIQDIKIGTFSKPVAVPSDGAGVRAFGDAVNDQNTEYAKHPEDYSIWNLGSFCDQSGEFTNKKPTMLASAVALLKLSA
nr:MAG TPA: DNA binding protein [Microviridae sp.]